MNWRFILFLFIASYSTSAPATEPNWLEIGRRIDAYANHPSPENARAATAVVPDAQVSFSGSAEETQANEIIYSGRSMAVLERQVLKREQASVELAFRLMSIADGAFAEDLDIILGKLIKVDPALFLTEMQRAKGYGVEGLVLNLDETYVDRLENSCAEWRLRKKSLQTVKVPGLESTKQKAIAVIDDQSGICGTEQISPTDAPLPAASGNR